MSLRGVVWPILIVLLILLAVVLLLAFVRSRYKVVGPNEALIISGSRRRARGERSKLEGGVTVQKEGALKVVTGGGTFIWPLVQKANRLSLEAMQLPVMVKSVPTQNKVAINVTATANVRIGNTMSEINAAATRFLSWGEQALRGSVNEILEGSLRAIIGTMTVERIIEDRNEFTKSVQTVAADDLKTMGLVIDVMNVKEITDEEGYIRNLGIPQVQIVRKNAEEATFRANLSIEEENQRTAREKAVAQRQTALLEAGILEETSAARRRAEQAGPLAEAQARQKVVETETEVAKLAAVKRQEELVAEITKPAEAESTRVQVMAQANAFATKEKAGADAERIRLEGLAQAEAETARAAAEGAKVREVALAKAEGLLKEAEALNAMQERAFNLRSLEIQPKIVEAAAGAFNNVDNLTLLGQNGLESFIAAVATLAQTYLRSHGGESGPLAAHVSSPVSPVVAPLPVQPSGDSDVEFEATFTPEVSTVGAVEAKTMPSGQPTVEPELDMPADQTFTRKLETVLAAAPGEGVDERVENLVRGLPEASVILERYSDLLGPRTGDLARDVSAFVRRVEKDEQARAFFQKLFRSRKV